MLKVNVESNLCANNPYNLKMLFSIVITVIFNRNYMHLLCLTPIASQVRIN